MRIRKKKWAKSELDSNNLLIKEPENNKGKWNKFFGNDNEIHIEIGCGKGIFISTLSEINKNINYIAIEKYETIIARAMRTARENGNNGNICFIAADAINLENIFESGEIDNIYLNFSDPWPKDKHKKRRLLHKNFLLIYSRILSNQGNVNFKTDNRQLFDFAVEELRNEGWTIVNLTYDLHNSDFNNNIMTEYEKRFSSLGNPIFRLEGIKP